MNQIRNSIRCKIVDKKLGHLSYNITHDAIVERAYRMFIGAIRDNDFPFDGFVNPQKRDFSWVNI